MPKDIKHLGSNNLQIFMTNYLRANLTDIAELIEQDSNFDITGHDTIKIEKLLLREIQRIELILEDERE